VHYRKVSSTEFVIKFQESERKDDHNELRYRTFKADDCAQIIAKIKFLVRAQGAKVVSLNQD
jgi:hypothetical protein